MQFFYDDKAARLVILGVSEAEIAAALEWSIGLTPREIDTLKLVAGGLSDVQIGAVLCIHKRTVRCHVSNAMLKLRVENRTQSALWVLRSGLISIEEAWRMVAEVQGLGGAWVNDSVACAPAAHVRLVKKPGQRWVDQVLAEMKSMVDHDGCSTCVAEVAAGVEEGEVNWRGVTR